MAGKPKRKENVIGPYSEIRAPQTAKEVVALLRLIRKLNREIDIKIDLLFRRLGI